MVVKKNYNLSKFTTMAMGGPARFFVVVKNDKELLEAFKFAKNKHLPWYVVGEGSNLIVSDRGYRGVIVQNKIQKFYPSSNSSPRQERRGVVVGAGNNLLKTIFRLNRHGLEGMERMAGIPGTVGGAVYGCAGAYGQEIKDHLVRVRIWDGKKFRYFNKKQCSFGYRESIFKKHKNWVITEIIFRLKRGSSRVLMKTSRNIIKLRQEKYKPGLKCPGSFFKNIKISDIHPLSLRRKFVKKINSDKIKYGKVPTGYLLEEVGAKGMKFGSIYVAKHHANLIYNPSGGKAEDVKKLARKLKKLVKAKFGIGIEEEVQYL